MANKSFFLSQLVFEKTNKKKKQKEIKIKHGEQSKTQYQSCMNERQVQ